MIQRMYLMHTHTYTNIHAHLQIICTLGESCLDDAEKVLEDMNQNDGTDKTFFDGYCSTVQGLLDWFEVDLGFTRAFIYSNRFVCSVCFCSLLPRLTLLLSFLDILHCLPRSVGVLLESALNLVSPMSPCGAHGTHACCARSNDHLLYLL